MKSDASNAQQTVFRYGTQQLPAAAESVQAGGLSAEIENGKIRHVTWNGVEVIRGIDAPIRDRDWGTVSVEVVSESISEDDHRWRIERKFRSVDQALAGTLVAEGRRDGTLNVEVSFRAATDFETARTGFALLHPIQGLAGESVRVVHRNGEPEELSFPVAISASQPVTEIVGLEYAIDGVGVEIRFSGEVFEMEDQRNWTDASFKTYCRPLSSPTPFIISRGETLSQSISISLSGTPEPADRSRIRQSASADGERIPEVMLALDSGTLPDPSTLSAIKYLGANRLLVRVHAPADPAPLTSIIRDLGLPFDLEVVCGDSEDQARSQLSQISRRLRSLDLEPDHVIAMPEAYTRSYQPDGEWPKGLMPQTTVSLVRDSFPNSLSGGGALTNFTEFNRCPPSPASDYITHATTAIVHAADDTSVFETLEALPDVFSSARRIAGPKAYRLGLTVIGMRTNPYGQGTAANPEQRRLEMAGADPRQRGLFAAAWMVGVAAATSGFEVEAMALAMPLGPLGLIYRREEWRQPYFDDAGDRVLVYPAYHVFRAFARMGSAERREITVPASCYAVACQTDAGMAAVVANGSDKRVTVEVPDGVRALLLDEGSFEQAVTDVEWLDRAERTRTDAVKLSPYATAFLYISDQGGRS